MEQPRHREAAAAEGDDGPGWSREPPGDGEGGGRPAGDSAAWNGSCGRPPAPGPEEEEEEDDDDLPFPSPDGPECSCRCRGEPAAPPSPGAERRDGSCSLTCHNRAATASGPPLPRGQEEGEEDGAGEDGAGKGGRRTRRRQRHRSAPKEKEEGGRREGGAGKRHRPARKRSRGDGVELPGPAEELAGCRGLLAAALAQARRLGAEVGGRLLCSCCRLGARDLGSAQAGVRSWGRRVGQRARSGSLRAARWLRAAAGLFLRLLWMLCALLLLLLMLLLGSLRLCWCLGAAALAAGAVRLGGSRRAARLLALLDAAVLRRTWGLLGESRTCRYLWDWLQRRRAPPWVPGGGRTGGLGDVAASSDGGASSAGSGEEVSRLLAMAEVPEEELNPFQVLGVEATASDTELKKAYRRLAVLVHPDKNEHPRAEAAFKVLRAAWDIVSSPERRKEYEIKRMAESELTRSMSEFLSRLQDDLKEAMNTMMCSKCQGKHKRFEMDRDPLSARYCAECGRRHPAEEGDFWAESSLLGLKITYFAMMDGKIYDITEWAGCQRVGISPDTHRVPYHISFGSRSSGPGGRQRSASKGSPPSAADLQDFFTRVFQGSSGPMPGGPFPPPPTPPRAAASPGVPPRTEGAAPKGDAKHKRRKKVRRPFQR
ncbi:dnaJ homolog subfamily C member 14 [Grus americana]|uniref:dnaJ homolog subfamily C member 14 n=1 Tax=Grus americana TaxID=9117 RepID=UPI002407D513|nr:dnaJ homolog subfamily C member 14 [Grus americana]XP_054663081.1 dnaJ homolog subfamily C member 14 [Grus americana]